MVHLRHLRHRPESGPQLTPWGFYATTPTKRRRDPLRAMGVAAGLTLVLAFGGCVVAVGNAAQDLGGAWGVATGPVAATTHTQVRLGGAFTLAGFRVAPGWTMAEESFDRQTLTGLRVTNTGDHAAELRYGFTFRQGSTWLAEIDCFCAPVPPGATATMQCFPTAHLPLGYDHIVVADSF